MAFKTENNECSNCGVSLRPGASFCHKCGEKFAASEDLSEKVAETAVPRPVETGVSSAWFKADITAPAAPEEVIEQPAAPVEVEFQETLSDAEIKTASAETEGLSAISDETYPIGQKISPEEVPEEIVEDIPETFVEEEAIPEPAPEPEPIAETEPAPAAIRAKPLREAPKPAPTDALRRKPKLQKEKIEVVWEQPEGGVNLVFIIGTIVIFVLVLFILLSVYWLK